MRCRLQAGCGRPGSRVRSAAMMRPSWIGFGVAVIVAACGGDSGVRRQAGEGGSGSVIRWSVPAASPDGAVAGYRAREGGATVVLMTDAGGAIRSVTETGDAGVATLSSAVPGVRAIAARGDRVWVAGTDALVALDAENGARRATVPLPEGVVASGLELGYDGTVFVADGAAHRVYAVRAGANKVIADDAALAGVGPLHIYGGRLVAGTATGLDWIDLKTGEREGVVELDGPVSGIAVDHLGYLVAAANTSEATGRLVRVTPEGAVTPLPVSLAAGARVAFDDRTRTLYVVEAGRVAAYDYLALTREDPKLWAARDRREMRPFEDNGIILAGAEYWPNRGDQECRYPEDVLWGFYPEAGVVFEGEAAPATPTAAARACAERAHRELRAWVATNPAEFHAAIARTGRSNRFYLWTNDYSEAADPFPHELRRNNVWYWERKPAVIGRVSGYWKWESTVLQDGTCLTPQPDQIEAALNPPPAPTSD